MVHVSNLLLPDVKTGYTTAMGSSYVGDSLELLESLPDESVDLVMTSPPFALLRKKEYGNEDQASYVAWLAQFAEVVKRKLKDTGSFVVDIGGAYEKGVPSRSLYNFRVPIYFCDHLGFFLAEDFYWFNPSKLPSPIEWVNKRKIRAKDSVNTVWWFSKTPYPKADVTNVLTPYSDRMKKLIKDPNAYYDAKKRPSGHDISKNFGVDNGGAIPSNLLQIPNSESNSNYLSMCKSLDIKGHPARFPGKLPEFFIKYLTDPGDVVVDIFGGSNTTGEIAEKHLRKWLSFDLDAMYVAASSFRFFNKSTGQPSPLSVFYGIQSGQSFDFRDNSKSLNRELTISWMNTEILALKALIDSEPKKNKKSKKLKKFESDLVFLKRNIELI